MNITLFMGPSRKIEVSLPRQPTVQELREKISEYVDPKFDELRNFSHAGTRLSDKPADLKIPLREGATVFVSTTSPVWAPGKFVQEALGMSNVRDICHLKPVATPESGVTPSRMRTNWSRYTDGQKAKILKKLSTPETGSIQIFLPPSDRQGLRNILIFYSEEHLEKLAFCAETTVDDLLDIAASARPDANEEEMSLIYLMFGDAVGMGCLSNAALTDRAQQILNTFFDMM